MKIKAQSICSILIIAIVLKSFFTYVSFVDAINMIALVSVYVLYELLTENKVVLDLKKLEQDQNSKIEKLQKDLDDTKNYMSKISTSIAFKR